MWNKIDKISKNCKSKSSELDETRAYWMSSTRLPVISVKSIDH